MKEDLLKVSLRQQAVYVPDNVEAKEGMTDATVVLVAGLASMGFTLSEALLRVVNGMNEAQMATLRRVLSEVMGMELNWTPLVKGWLEPTNETRWDHVYTYLYNIIKANAETEGEARELPCGHKIPEGTFSLERYNGCPFCGKPFVTGQLTPVSTPRLSGKELRLWREHDLKAHFEALLTSPVPLDATQTDSLKRLLTHFTYPYFSSPKPPILMKETALVVADFLLENDGDERGEREVERLLTTPTDVLRFLWYKKTGLLQLVEPRTLIANAARANRHHAAELDESQEKSEEKRRELRLHYSRKWCRRVAVWLNNMAMEPQNACEMMHPKREMWVRFIRALRLAEYSKRRGMERLGRLLDCFYRGDYDVWQGKVSRLRLERETEATLRLLKERPGVFARMLFANMLWFGSEPTLEVFRSVTRQLPLRLLFTLGMYADTYFAKEGSRVVRPLGAGLVKVIGSNPRTAFYQPQELEQMKQEVTNVYLEELKRRFAEGQPATSAHPRKMYIDPMLFDLPLAIGDRSQTVQDTSTALQGTHFRVRSERVRLFLQWGKGLPAQAMDMDLSAKIVYGDGKKIVDCSYFNLSPHGARHSGDIRSIPNFVGTAEYVELNLPVLEEDGARFVAFVCNSYTTGGLSPNLVVGWMDAEDLMEVSEETGVAYDPAAVQHQVRVPDNHLSKGLVFGILDIPRREIIWMEIPFMGQTVLQIGFESIMAYLKRLSAKTKIGDVLCMKAEAQHLMLTENRGEADEIYTYEWAKDAAAVSKVLFMQ